MNQHPPRGKSASVRPSLRGLEPRRTADGIWYGVIGAGPPLLLLPGFAASHAAWSPLVPLLKPRFTLVLVDLPGVGQGPALREDRNFSQLIAPLPAILDHGELDRVHVLGASLGGLVGMWLAREHPERVDRLVLAGSMACLPAEERPRFDQRIQTLRRDGPGAFARAMMEDLLTSEFREAHARVVEAVVQAYALEMPSPDRVELLARLVRQVDLRPHLGEIAAPTLVLHGGRDRLIPVEQAESLARALPRAQLEVFAEAGHHLLLEQRTDVPSRLVRFLVERDRDPEA